MTPLRRRLPAWRTVAAIGRRRFLEGVDFIYPPACPFCQSCDLTSAGCCVKCDAALSHAAPHSCWRCSAPVGPYLATRDGCVHCRKDAFAFERVFSLGVYAGALRTACLSAKSSRSPLMGANLGDLLCRRLSPELTADEVDVVTPVPLHWTSRLARRDSLADVVAARLARFLKAPVDRHILRKVRRTAPQASLPPSRRRENLRGAFRIARGVRLDGCRVLLVDDVLTTGTTAHRAARVLIRDGGAVRVLVAVIARGIGN